MRQQYQADHLRGIAERNGNTRLGDAATRMEQRGLERPVPRERTLPSRYGNTERPGRGQRLTPEQAVQNAYGRLPIPPRASTARNSPVPPAARNFPPVPAAAQKPTWSERFRGWLSW